MDWFQTQLLLDSLHTLMPFLALKWWAILWSTEGSWSISVLWKCWLLSRSFVQLLWQPVFSWQFCEFHLSIPCIQYLSSCYWCVICNSYSYFVFVLRMINSVRKVSQYCLPVLLSQKLPSAERHISSSLMFRSKHISFIATVRPE
jgi:hypothetical protein